MIAAGKKEVELQSKKDLVVFSLDTLSLLNGSCISPKENIATLKPFQ